MLRTAHRRANAAPLALLLALAVPTAVRADDLHTPYDLQVVVHCERHRVLTDDFRKQIMREVGDTLRNSLGPLVHVRISAEAPGLASVLRDGLGALDTWSASSPGGKTHFVLIDYKDGQYDIHARQFDETTGLASPGPVGLYGRAHPVIRHERTRDRAFVAVLAAGMVEQDLGLIGSVVNKPDKDGLVQLRLQGGALGGPLDRLVRPGHIFAVAAPRAPSRPGEALPWAILLVEKAPTNGVCDCSYFSRNGDPLRPGYLCMLLGTVTAPLRLHLSVGDATSLTLEIRRRSFEDKPFDTLQSRSPSDRLVRAPAEVAPFAHVAFVTVRNRKDPIPVALIDQEPVEIAIGAETRRDPLRFSRENWEQNVTATFLKIDPFFEQLNKRTAENKDRGLILRLAQDDLQELHADMVRLSAQRKDLLEEAGHLAPEARATLVAAGDDRLRKVREAEKQLEQMVNTLLALEKEEPKRQDWLRRLNEAKGLEAQDKIDEALSIYRAILQENVGDKALAEHVAKLETIWKPANEEHQQARLFFYKTWPKLTSPGDLLKHLDEAGKDLDICIQAKDRFGPSRFLTVTVAHSERLTQSYAKLKPEINRGDEDRVKEIKEVTEKLDGLARKAQKFLRPGPGDQ